MKRLAATANEEVLRGETLFKQLLQEAIRETILLFRSKVCEQFHFKSILSTKRIGKVGDTYPDYPIQRGFEVVRWNDDLYQTTKIETIRFRSKNEGLAKLWIETDSEVLEQEIAVKKGINTFRIDYETVDNITITLDPCIWIATGGNCGGNCNCDCGDMTCGSLYIRPIYKEKKGEWQYGGSGIQINASVRADDAHLLCEFAQEMAPAIRLMLGIKLMEEGLVSDGIHPLIRNGKADAERLLVMWQGGVNALTGFEEKSKFWQTLSPACKQASEYLKQSKSPAIKQECAIVHVTAIP